MPALDDAEGPRVPEDLPEVVDAHVHVFPQRLFEAVWRWFDAYGWPIRYRLPSEETIGFLRQRGVAHQVLLHYAHRPGLAGDLNRYVAELARRHPDVTGLATVHPGDADPGRLVEAAFDDGLAGLKLHCHVQCIPPDDRRLAPVYEVCAARGRPVVVHAGRQPKSPHYGCDVEEICDAARIERILGDHPDLHVCVPHLGADEYEAYEALLRRHDRLWLDTTMVLAGYFPMTPPEGLLRVRPDRVLYGTDFPNLPYAWDRELRRIRELDLPGRDLEALLAGNARRLFGLP